MKNPTLELFAKLFRYLSIFGAQTLENREYLYFLILATVMDIGLMMIVHPWGWIAALVFNLFIGLIAIGNVVRRVEKAFESLGLDFTRGYGTPQWIINGKYPANQDIIRITSAGYGAADYERHIGHIAARLNQPIKEVRKPSSEKPVLEVVLEKTSLPSLLEFGQLPMDELKPGEFFIGQSNDGFVRLSLKHMIHMLVAGQTGAGKTQFLRQFIATTLTHCRESFVALIDMKGGIDFQSFLDVPNFKLVSSYNDADSVLSEVISLFEKRKEYLLAKKKTNWAEVSLKELEQDPAMAGLPIGPVIVIVDELAELSKKANERSAKSTLQDKLATLARLARFTGIHLVLGTQRPDKSTLDMQSKDNIPTRVCLSVPSVIASTLVVGDMSASTLGNIPGRAIFQLSGNKVVQTPLVENAELDELLTKHTSRLEQNGYTRGLGLCSRAGTSRLKAVPQL